MANMFPEFLNKGSTGPAVKLLQLMLLCGGYNHSIVPDGDYGEQTALGVRTLQRALQFKGDDVDGNFGPKTREALRNQRHLDVNALSTDCFNGETVPAAA